MLTCADWPLPETIESTTPPGAGGLPVPVVLGAAARSELQATRRNDTPNQMHALRITVSSKGGQNACRVYPNDLDLQSGPATRNSRYIRLELGRATLNL